jgi:hypothetical protein
MMSSASLVRSAGATRRIAAVCIASSVIVPRVDFSPADHNPLGASATSDGRYADMGQPHLAAARHHPRGSLGGGALTFVGRRSR